MSDERSMMDIAPTVCAVLRLPAPAQAKGQPIEPIVRDLGARANKVAVLAPDALGLFAWNLWRQEMPFLSSLHTRNSLVVRSVMPSITPVNFATMVTGTDQAGHGIRAFNDRFACETVFDVVRRAGGRSAGIGLDGYTGSQLLGRFADICGNAGHGSDDAVAERVQEIAGRQAPQFLIAQFGRVDDTFHLHGPSARAVVPMLRATDARFRRLIEFLNPLGYGVIVVSDHGQHDVPSAPPGALKGAHRTDSPEDCLVPCTWS